MKPSIVENRSLKIEISISENLSPSKLDPYNNLLLEAALKNPWSEALESVYIVLAVWSIEYGTYNMDHIRPIHWLVNSEFALMASLVR